MVDEAEWANIVIEGSSFRDDCVGQERFCRFLKVLDHQPKAN